MSDGGWNPEKVRIFREQYEEFRYYVSINSKDLGGGAVLGEHTYLSQKMLLDGVFNALSNDIHDIKVLKSRQLGVTTESRALSLFWNGVHNGLQGSMVYDTDSNKNNARRDLELVINSLPTKLKFPKIVVNNRDGFILSNNSKIAIMAAGTRSSRTSGGLGRSVGLNFAHCTEMCSWENTEGVISFQQSLSEIFQNRLYLWESPLSLDTPLLTPEGWTTIGGIKVGDFVYDENGKATEVAGLSPVFEGRRCFEITFDTGEKIISDASHKWQVGRLGSSCSRWSTNVVTTAQLDQNRDRIWLGEPIEGRTQELPIQPYFLGAWLGDGHNEAVRITCGEADMQEMRDNLKNRGVACGPITKFKGRGGGVFGIMGLMPVFRGMNLISNKHIPEIYLRSTVEDRLELLRGLMDTDGSIVEEGHCLFTNSCAPLINNFCELLASLSIRFRLRWHHPGIKTFANGKAYDCRPYASIGFKPHAGMKVFSLKRKLARQTAESKMRPRRSRVARILSIREVPSVPVKCISVDTPTHLFKVGRTMIPTHNTARGPGLWQDMWDDARKDTTNQKAVFIGWWAKDSQRLDKNSRAFHQYGLTPPNADEQKRIDAVQRLYGVTVTQEQLAWYRRKMDPSGEGEDDVRDQREGDDFKNAEQPWTEDEAFIAAGSTFFAPERLAEIRGKDTSNKYKGYRYYPGTSFVTCQVEPARNWRETQLKVWEEPVDDAIYVIAGDPAFGHDEENDNSCLEVLRCYADCIEQVAEFSDPLTPTNHFAWIMWSLIGWYGGGHSGNATNPVHSILELNGPGDAVWLEFKSVPNIARNGYLRVEAKEKGLLNIFNNVRNYIYTRSDSMGVGSAYHFKCLALDTPIPTPSGWAEMQDLKVGDKVYSDKGDPCSVIGVSPVYENKECFDVVFDDGGCITADADHLWELFDGSIVKTKQLQARHSRIRVTGHLLGSFAALPIDPYTLGVWLGDGASACGRIHGHIKDLEEVRLQIAPYEQVGPITPEKKNKQIGYFSIQGFTTKLRSLGVLNNKHIPPAYLRASLADRLGLLQGLMDTDGTINAKNGRQCAFVTTSPALRDGFAELLRSLGIKAKYVTKNPMLFYNGSMRICAEAYQFWFTAYPDLPVFRMKRKRERAYPKAGQKLRSTAKTHRVMQVVPRASVPVKCIMVDSPSHLFLAGRSMIPTHNTTGATKVSIMERLRGYTLDGTVIVHSQDALDEMRQVTRKGDVIKAEGRKKDDKVITLALGCRAWDDRARKALIAQNLTKKADSARRAASIQDQYTVFSNNMLSDFFKSKQRVRLHERAMLRRQGWRGR